MLLQPTATILDRLQVNQLVAAKQQPMVEAGPGQTAEVSGARDDRKLFVGMLSKGQVRVTIMVVVIIIEEVDDDDDGSGGGGRPAAAGECAGPGRGRGGGGDYLHYI